MTIREFQVLSLMAGERQVAGEITIEAVWQGDGLCGEEIHLWMFDDAGLVSRIRH